DNLWYACYCESNSCDPAPTRSCGGSFPDNYWTPGRDDQPVRLNGNSFTTVCGDIDNDGDMDLYTTEILHQWAGFSADGSQLLLNDGTGHFERIDNENNGLTRPRPRQGDWNEGDLHAAFFDFDNDGWKDILLSSSDYEKTQLWLWRQVSPGVFLEVSDATGLNQPWPAGVAVADFDRDGDLDVVTGSSNARSGTPWTTRQAHLYLNDSPPGNWIRLEGFPIGTQVTVTAGGISQTQEVSGGYGHFGIQNDLPLQFGLGSVCQVDQVQARYPGGKVKSWAGVAGNQAVTLK
ncbi:MAG TPA: VCBS repeat-containing protein, partial [Myxococcota bacterium]|nr:VCBS repeat-containing protein [Myxococcota bacterium]